MLFSKLEKGSQMGSKEVFKFRFRKSQILTGIPSFDFHFLNLSFYSSGKEMNLALLHCKLPTFLLIFLISTYFNNLIFKDRIMTGIHAT